MKRKVLVVVLHLMILQTSIFAQSIINWQHHYARPIAAYEMGSEIALNYGEEFLLFDKSTFNFTSIQFPGEIRNLSYNRFETGTTIYSHYITLGPDSSLLLRGSDNGAGVWDDYYQFDGYNVKKIEKFKTHDIKDVNFYYNKNNYNVYYLYADSSYNIEGHNTIKKFIHNQSPFRSGLNKIHITENANIFLSGDFTVDIYNGEEWLRFDTSNFTPNFNWIRDVASDKQDNISFESSDILYTFNNSLKSWATDSIPTSLYHRDRTHLVNSITYDNNDNLWIVGYGIFAKFDGTDFTDYYSNEIKDNSYFINSDYPNNIVLFTGFELYRYYIDDKTFLPIKSKSSNLIANNISSSVKLPNNDIYFGVNQEYATHNVIKHSGNNWKNINIPSSFILALSKDSGNSILASGVSSYHKIFRVTDTVVSFVDSTNNDGAIQNGAVGKDKNGHYWFGSNDNSSAWLTEWNNGLVQKHINPLATNSQVRNVYVDSNDTKWVTYTVGLYSYKNNSWTRYTTQNSIFEQSKVFHITEEPGTNILWFSTEKGFFKLDHGTWSKFDTDNSPIPSNTGQYIYFDDEGRQWFATRNGLATLKQGKWEVYTTFNSPLRSGDVQSIVQDNSCHTWICTQHGMNKVTLNCASNEDKIFSGTVFSSNANPEPNVLVKALVVDINGNDFELVDNRFTDSNGHFTFYLEEDKKYYFEAKPNKRDDSQIISMYKENASVIQDDNGIENHQSTRKDINIYQFETIPTFGSSSINGQIESTSERIGNLRILLINEDQIIAETYTNQAGSFNFPNLPEKNYRIWVDKPNLMNETAPVIYINKTNNQFQFELLPERLILLNRGNNPPSTDNAYVYPNPFYNKLIVTTTAWSRAIARIKLSNIFGQTIYKQSHKITYGQNKIEIPTTDLSRGIYFYNVNIDQKNFTGKLFKL